MKNYFLDRAADLEKRAERMKNCGCWKTPGKHAIMFSDNSNPYFKKKYVHEFEAKNCDGVSLFKGFVKINKRPMVDIEEVEIKLQNGGKMWIPGKATWDDLHIKAYDFEKEEIDKLTSAKTGILRLFDGCGVLLETWTMDLVFKSSTLIDYATEDDFEIAFAVNSANYSGPNIMGN